MLEELLKQKGFWAANGPNNHIALSSRLRLARNMHSVAFPDSMDSREAQIIQNAINKFTKDSCFRSDLNCIDLSEISSNEKRLLRERNIITHEMELSDQSIVVVNNRDDFNILVNEEDHFRIQVIKPGLQLMEVFLQADKVDDELNLYVPYAFSEDFGYLTACTSNLGTGLRISVLLHLPVLTKKEMVFDLMTECKSRGIDLKGTISENNKSLGSIYQLSNKVSLGLSEIDIIESLDGMANEIIDAEDKERDTIIADSRSEYEDLIWRSYGLLQYSRRLSYVEAMEHLSNVRLGVVLAIIKNLDVNDVNDLMVTIQWAHLQRNSGRFFRSTLECDEYRAEYVKTCLV